MKTIEGCEINHSKLESEMNLKTRLIKLEEKIEPDTFIVFYDPVLAAADSETQLRYCIENGLDKNKVLFANDIDAAL